MDPTARGRNRKGGMIANVILVGVLVIVGSASLTVFLLPGNSPQASHNDPNVTITYTSTVVTQHVSTLTVTVQVTSYHTQTNYLNETSTVTSTYTTLSTQAVSTTYTILYVSTTTYTAVVVSTQTQVVYTTVTTS